MKKISYLLIIFCSIFIFNITVRAASASLSVSSNNIYSGESFTATINVSNAVSWDVHVISSGPVSGCIIDQSDVSSDAMDTNKTFTATCTATGEGQIVVSLSGNVTSASDGIAVDVSDSKTVTVSTKPVEPTPSENANNNTSTVPTDNKSTNNNLKEIKVEGFNIIMENSNSYTVYVPNAIESIKLIVVAEDKKAIIGGNGTHKLDVGENNIDVTIISEAGLQNKIYVKAIRQETNLINNIREILKYSTQKEITFDLDEFYSFEPDIIEAIKDSKKTIVFNYKPDDEVIYTWILNGTKLKKAIEFLTTVIINPEDETESSEKEVFEKGITINIESIKYIPEGSVLRIYVKDKYKDGDVLKLYSYEKGFEDIKILDDNITVKDGYIEFEPTTDNYILSEEELASEDIAVIETAGATKTHPRIITIIVSLVILSLIGVGTYFFIKRKKKSKKVNTIDTSILAEETNTSDNYIEEIK